MEMKKKMFCIVRKSCQKEGGGQRRTKLRPERSFPFNLRTDRWAAEISFIRIFHRTVKRKVNHLKSREMSRRLTLTAQSASIRYRVSTTLLFLLTIHRRRTWKLQTTSNLFSHVSRGQARIKPSMTQLPFRSRHHNLSRFNFYPSHTCFFRLVVDRFGLSTRMHFLSLLYLKSLLPLHIT